MLTPLQEVASRIYAGLVVANKSVQQSELDWARKAAIDEAKALLEATKPEPLEWKETQTEEEGHYHTSKAGELQIEQIGSDWFGLVYLNGNPICAFKTLEEAKQFAEHIRTR